MTRGCQWETNSAIARKRDAHANCPHHNGRPYGADLAPGVVSTTGCCDAAIGDANAVTSQFWMMSDTEGWTPERALAPDHGIMDGRCRPRVATGRRGSEIGHGGIAKFRHAATEIARPIDVEQLAYIDALQSHGLPRAHRRRAGETSGLIKIVQPRWLDKCVVMH